MEKLFTDASRLKLRFNTVVGVLSVEDLWDLPLESKNKVNLDSIAINLHRELKDTKEESFISKSKANPILEMKLDIVKYIIGVKLQESEDRAKAKVKSEQRAKIADLIEEKQNESLKSLSLDELKALYNAWVIA
mgnify:CR=1 FL=1